MDFEIGDLAYILATGKCEKVVDRIIGIGMTEEGWMCWNGSAINIQNNKLVRILCGETSC